MNGRVSQEVAITEMWQDVMCAMFGVLGGNIPLITCSANNTGFRRFNNAQVVW
jgi:hypothetical protein